LIAEGFGGMMDSAEDKHLFSRVKVRKDKVQVSHLQFADDTLVIGEATLL